MQTDKTCKKCKQIKPIEEFYKSGVNNGYRNVCKQCENAKRRKQKSKKPRTGKRLFYSDEIIAMSKIHKSIKVSYFNIFLGIMFEIRDGEIFCFSSLRGSTSVRSKAQGRQWLASQILVCAADIEDKLFKKAKRGVVR